jgi:hypothetical protein
LNLTAKVKSSQMPKSSGTPNLAEQIQQIFHLM